MLEVGNGGMTVAEYRSHFSIWALAKVSIEFERLSYRALIIYTIFAHIVEYVYLTVWFI